MLLMNTVVVSSSQGVTCCSKPVSQIASGVGPNASKSVEAKQLPISELLHTPNQQKVTTAEFTEPCHGIASECCIGDYIGHQDSVLPRECRQRLHKLFARIEREFEREYQRVCAENITLQERLEKYEEGEHAEALTFGKKLSASQLSHRIKQQYKQSTFKLVSSLRQSSGHSNLTGGGLGFLLPSSGNQNINAPLPLGGSTESSAPSGILSSPYNGRTSNALQGSFSGHGGSWKLLNRAVGHRDGIWEVTAYHRLLASASADNTVRLWSNTTPMSCLLVYLGHFGSVNSVRFRDSGHLMLTSSGDGTAHLVRLPEGILVSAATGAASGDTASSNPPTTLSTDTSLSGMVTTQMSETTAATSLFTSESTITNLDLSTASTHKSNEQLGNTEDSPVRSGTDSQPSSGPPIVLRHPHAVFQSVNLSLPAEQGGTGGDLVSGSVDSSPLAAADFLSARDQLVTAGWDRLGRVYDLNTGQEVTALTGHDHQLTDVRCANHFIPVVITSGRDSTFRIWDFRSACSEVHVQQAHNNTVSTAQFLPGPAPEHVVSAGTDRCCRLWDLRNFRSPVFTIRTDAAINRLAISHGRPSDNELFTSLSEAAQLQRNAPFSVAGSMTAPNTSASVGATLSSTGASASLPHAVEALSDPSPYTMGPTKNITQCMFALPLDSRTVRFVDMHGSRIGRLPRSLAQSHARIITSAAWADEGRCNFFSTGFDQQILGWQLQFT